ncbi:HDIG domain-containing protein [Candidatus Woesebacteria bacterium]|nr:HDIG domain-containing protein [Candidatus Woesebacteria bacterium]
MPQVPSHITLPIEPLLVLHRLTQAGFAVYIVGGAVRDLILSERDWLLMDFDITTNATPQELLTIFPDAFYENSFGTVSLTYQNLWQTEDIDKEYRDARELIATSHQASKSDPRLIDLVTASKVHTALLDHDQAQPEMTDEAPTATLPLIEITTFRSGEKYHEGARRPSEVQWGHSLIEDLQRRDFTINAMALKLDSTWISGLIESLAKNPPTLQGLAVESDHFELIDRFEGLADLDQRIIRSVGDAEDRIKEDALRMLRAIRFAVQLNCSIEDSLRSAISKFASQLADVSAERVRDELIKMLLSPQPKRAIELLDEVGLLEMILPELVLAKGVRQGGHHTTDVWQHSLDALEACPSPDPVVRLATLLHDISKPTTYNDESGQPTFYNHEVIGARVAKQIGQRLRFSKRDCERLFTLVRYHMFHYQPENSDAAIRRFMRKVGLENIDDILDLRESDRLGSGARKTSWRLEEMKERMVDQLNQPLDVTDLAINGNDLMTEFDLRPSRQLGELLQSLFEIVLEEPEKNNRETLLALTREILTNPTVKST